MKKRERWPLTLQVEIAAAEHAIQSPQDCPRFQGCSSPVCPMDNDWPIRVLEKSDPTCFYLTEAVKDGAEKRFGAAGLQDLYSLVSEVGPAIANLHPRVRDGLARARYTGSRMEPVPRGASS